MMKGPAAGKFLAQMILGENEDIKNLLKSADPNRFDDRFLADLTEKLKL